jgi:hypothetical protein
VPALEPPESDLEVVDVASTGDDLRLVAFVAEPRHLAELELAIEKRDVLVVQSTAGRAAVEHGVAEDETA